MGDLPRVARSQPRVQRRRRLLLAPVRLHGVQHAQARRRVGRRVRRLLLAQRPSRPVRALLLLVEPLQQPVRARRLQRRRLRARPEPRVLRKPLHIDSRLPDPPHKRATLLLAAHRLRLAASARRLRLSARRLRLAEPRRQLLRVRRKGEPDRQRRRWREQQRAQLRPECRQVLRRRRTALQRVADECSLPAALRDGELHRRQHRAAHAAALALGPLGVDPDARRAGEGGPHLAHALRVAHPDNPRGRRR
mmetsp:Transcript_12203/g.35242  ORF Transcript_12203/g.35242 Transcript_12203/m.35242 type:complete len:250 (-) Transcript_12203:10-759(-)